MFFRTKSETARDRTFTRAHQAGGSAAAAGEHAGQSIRSLANSWMHGVSETVGPRAESVSASARERAAGASALARERAGQARDRAMSGIDHGIDTAVPRAQESLAGVSPKIDQARDTLVEDLLPRLQQMLGSVQTTKDDVLSRQTGTVAAVTGAPKKPKRKGGLLLTLGLLAAVGAAVSYYLSQQSQDEAIDPWAGSGDRPIGGAPGVDAQVRGDLAETRAPVAAETAAEAEVRPEPEPQARLMDTDDVPGTDPDARTGFGTDFGTEGEKPRT